MFSHSDTSAIKGHCEVHYPAIILMKLQVIALLSLFYLPKLMWLTLSIITLLLKLYSSRVSAKYLHSIITFLIYPFPTTYST